MGIKMKTTNSDKILRMVQLAILTAIVVLLQCFGGLLRLPFMGTAGNLVLIPIALGAVLLGRLAGAWLGLVCGVVILLYGVTGADPFTHFLFISNPLVTILICLVKTTLAGYLSALVYRLLEKKNAILALFVAAILVPVVNTGVFVLGGFTILETIRLACGLPEGANVVSFLFFTLAGVNFLFELGITLVLTPAVERILYVIKKK